MFIPDFTKVIYLLNEDSGRYEKQPDRVPFMKLPNDLKVETTREPILKRNGANEIITGRIKNGNREFFTGLIPINAGIWFYGNDYKFANGQKKNSLVVFKFCDRNRKLKIFYFNSFYKENRAEREKFILDFITIQS